VENRLYGEKLAVDTGGKIAPPIMLKKPNPW
jgi:hypothetical protein